MAAGRLAAPSTRTDDVASDLRLLWRPAVQSWLVSLDFVLDVLAQTADVPAQPSQHQADVQDCDSGRWSPGRCRGRQPGKHRISRQPDNAPDGDQWDNAEDRRRPSKPSELAPALAHRCAVVVEFTRQPVIHRSPPVVQRISKRDAGRTARCCAFVAGLRNPSTQGGCVLRLFDCKQGGYRFPPSGVGDVRDPFTRRCLHPSRCRPSQGQNHVQGLRMAAA